LQRLVRQALHIISSTNSNHNSKLKFSTMHSSALPARTATTWDRVKAVKVIGSKGNWGSTSEAHGGAYAQGQAEEAVMKDQWFYKIWRAIMGERHAFSEEKPLIEHHGWNHDWTDLKRLVQQCLEFAVWQMFGRKKPSYKRMQVTQSRTPFSMSSHRILPQRHQDPACLVQPTNVAKSLGTHLPDRSRTFMQLTQGHC